MAEPTTPATVVTQTGTPAPTTDAPVTPAFDPKELEARFTALIEERVKGFQRMVSEKDQTIADLQRELKTTSMSEEEREQLAAKERDEEREQLALENQLLKLGQQYPNEVAIVQKMLAGQSVEDYVAALHEAMKPATPATPEPEQQVSDVDRNNPPATPTSASAGADMIRLPDGQMITREAGLEILKGAQTLHG